MNKLMKVDDGLMERLQREVTELKGTGFGPMLKFDANQKKYFVGDDEVALGREYIAHCDQFARGWTKFIDKKPVDMRVLNVRDGWPPSRKELDDLELAGTDDDRWVYQRYLPLEDTETGDIVVFVSKSIGGKIALGELLDVYARNFDRGLPIVKLAISTFKSSEYGPKPRPDFKIVGWDTKAVKTVAPPDDDFGGDSGPPERDPSDPGYDILNLSR